jgi:hypothetical protein
VRSAEEVMAAIEPCDHKRGMPCPVCGRGRMALVRWVVAMMAQQEEALLGPSGCSHGGGLYEERLPQMGLLFRRETKRILPRRKSA